MRPNHVLLIEDSPDYTDIITEFLTHCGGYEVCAVGCPHDAFEALQIEDFDLIICDLHLPFITNEQLFQYSYSVEVGVRTIEELREVFPEKPFLGITAAMESDLPITQRLAGKVPVLYKPFSARQFLEVVRELIGNPATEESHIVQ